MKALSYLGLVTAALAGRSPIPHMQSTEKPEMACSLPECNEKTTHNGGYCCAEHCRTHRQMQKEKRLSTIAA